MASARISARFIASGESAAVNAYDSAFTAESFVVIVWCSSRLLGRY